MTPRLVLELSAGLLALSNVSWLTTGNDLSFEDLQVDFLVPHHLKIDWSRILESNRSTVDGTDCSSIDQPLFTKPRGTLGRLMLSPLQRGRDRNVERESKQINRDPNLPRVNFFAHKIDIDPFPDPNFIGLEESERDKLEGHYFNAISQQANNNWLPESHSDQLQIVVWQLSSTFDTQLSPTPSRVEPVLIDLTTDAKPWEWNY